MLLGFTDVKLSLRRKKRKAIKTLIRSKRRIRSPSERILETTTAATTGLDINTSLTETVPCNNLTTQEFTPKPECMHPEYVVYTWVLSMIALATALKLYYLIKLLLAILMVALYTTLIVLPSNHIFNEMRGSKLEPE